MELQLKHLANEVLIDELHKLIHVEVHSEKGLAELYNLHFDNIKDMEKLNEILFKMIRDLECLKAMRKNVVCHDESYDSDTSTADTLPMSDPEQ